MIGVRWGGNAEQCLAMQTTRIGCGISSHIRLGNDLLRNGDYDLLRLGADFESWRTLRMVTQNKMATFYVDGKKVFAHPYKQDLGLIEALELALKGPGSVDWVRLTNSRTGQVVYTEDF